MSRIRYSTRSREDLFEIWRYVATHNSEAVADRVFDNIERACGRLKDHPGLGRGRPEIHADARSLVIDRWLAIYRVAEAGAQVVRVVDGARDLSTIEWASDWAASDGKPPDAAG